MLFPAYAGVILITWLSLLSIAAFPRTCGGDPNLNQYAKAANDFSPHMRG